MLNRLLFAAPLLLVVVACEPPVPPPVAAPSSSSAPLAPKARLGADGSVLQGAPRALRAALIAARQRDAGPAYALRPSLHDGEAFVGELPRQHLVVRHDAEGTSLGVDEDAPDLTMAVAGVRCDDTLQTAMPATPQIEHNTVRTPHALSGGGTLESWYVSGPLGLEQGFTVDGLARCTALEVAVDVTGAQVEQVGDAWTLVTPFARYAYGELFVTDAAGRELPARVAARVGGLALVVDAGDAQWPVMIDPLIAVEQAELTVSDAAPSDFISSERSGVSIDGDTALVGGQFDDDNGTDSGSAYGGLVPLSVEIRSGDLWDF